ncbi:three prime repair exonuclease 2 [Chrysemys picta bellii]|uniref:three prime repair exonuclease 2 n=1 Tax=Chrysemys picta bellii TaxID=8478 RepID=UPI0032B14993
MMAPQDFQTFVFFDLETTGLPPDRPRITELSLFALHRHSLLQCPPQDAPAPRLPRVLDQLTLCIDPQQPFTPEAARITGLSQQDLEENGKRGLDRAVAQALGGFLARQAPPLCLVAHNGWSYDFPLLRTELARVGAELPPATGCLDTLQAMKELGLAGQGGYSLGALFRGLFGRDPDGAHSAEGDVRTLIAIFLARAPQLMGWAAGKARAWGDVTPMYLPTTQ